MKKSEIKLTFFITSFFLTLINVACNPNTSQQSDVVIDSASVYNAYKAKYNFSENNNTDSKIGKDLTELFGVNNDSLFNGNYEGEPVDTQDAEPCRKYYEKLMDSVTIKDDGSEQQARIGRMTKTINFKNDKLIAWLDTVKNHGANLIKITFGRYNETFLNKHVNDHNEHQKRRNRLTVFLYPYQVTSKVAPDGSKIIAPVGKTVFDLGGIHP